MKQLIKLTSNLVKFETVKGRPDELRRCIDYVQKQFPKHIYITKGINKGKPYLIASVKKTKRPDLLFVCHLDVVEAEPEQFKPKLKGNRLYGRGAQDMKSGAAIAIQLLKEEKEKNIAAMFTTDEEIGGENGVGFLVKKWKPKMVIAIEPSKARIVTKHKGVLWIKLKAKGKSAHGSTPWEGDNSIDKLLDGYERVKRILKQKTRKKWQLTYNLGMIKGGDAFNKVPDEAEFGLDIRYTENDDLNKIIKKIRKIKNLKLKIIQKQPMLNTNEDSPEIKKLKKISERIFRQKVDFFHQTGASDVRYFGSKGIAAINFGPLGKNLHSKNEWVDLRSVEKIFLILKEYIRTL